MNLTPGEKENLIENLKYIVRNNKGKSKKEFIEVDLGLSNNTYQHIVSSDTLKVNSPTLQKITNYINKNWHPSIENTDILEKKLFSSENRNPLVRKKEVRRISEFYEGTYFCYYFSKRSGTSDLRYGILNIFSKENEAYADMICGFRNKEELYEYINVSANNHANITDNERKNALNKFFNKKDLKRYVNDYCRDNEYIYARLYTGTIEILEHSLVFNLYAEDKTYKRFMILSRPLISKEIHYRGGILTVFTTEHYFRDSTCDSFQYMGISHHFVNDTEKISEMLKITIDSDRWTTTAGNDRNWYNYLREKWRWKQNEFPEGLKP